MNFKKEVIFVLICASLVASTIITTQTVQATIDVYPWDPYPAIQNAIKAAPYDATIRVHAGTYNEAIQLKWNVTIIGDGAETTIINGTGKPGPAVVTLDCPGPLSFSGFTIVNASADGGGHRFAIYAIQTTPKAGVTYTISYCKIYGTGDPNEYQDYGFYGYGGKEDIVFTHNLVTQTGANNILLELHTGATEITYNTLDAGCWGSDDIYDMTYNGIDVTALQNVSYNAFDMGTGGPFDDNHRATGVTFAIYPAGGGVTSAAKFTNMVVSGNIFNNLQSFRRAIGFYDAWPGSNLVSPSVTENLVNGLGKSASYGISIYGDTSDSTISCNTIKATEVGIYLRNGDAPETTINNNNITGNTVGVDWTLGLTAVNATGNWWGSADGPGPVGPGTGDPVTGNVNYSPFLTAPAKRIPSLYINPTEVNKTPGDVGTTFTVAVTLFNFTDLKGFDINMTWDDNLIILTGVDYTTPLNTLWGTGKWKAVLNQSGTGYYFLGAYSNVTVTANNTGASVLFNLTFKVVMSWTSPLSTAIQFAVVRLSDASALPPTYLPNPIPAAATDGTYTMSAMVPGLEFKVEKQNKKNPSVWDVVTTGPPYHFESRDHFRIDVYVTNVGSLANYSLTIGFTTGVVAFQGVEYWGIFGPGTVSYIPGMSVIVVKGSGLAWSGSIGLLCKLNFTVSYTVSPDHIWKYGNLNYAALPISITDANLGFGSLGIILMAGITVAPALSIHVDFIRGDVNCDGAVNMADIGEVAYYYGQAVSPPAARYDLNNDNFIDIYDIVTIATNYGYGT